MTSLKKLKIKTIFDNASHPELSYGGGRGNRQSAMETIFFNVEKHN